MKLHIQFPFYNNTILSAEKLYKQTVTTYILVRKNFQKERQEKELQKVLHTPKLKNVQLSFGKLYETKTHNPNFSSQ